MVLNINNLVTGDKDKDSSNKEIKDYWEDFYNTQTSDYLAAPSQFAVFSLVEIEGIELVIDFGCGNGRDSLFFASQGKKVIGIDQSEAAINLCCKQADKHNLNEAEFLCSDVGNLNLFDELIEMQGDKSVAFYARFFLHAIDSEKEDIFLRMASKICGSTGILAVEFRTVRDISLSKETDSHYRRFIQPLTFLSKAKQVGFEPSYFVEGFGYAKYKQDDAHIARFILANKSI